MAEIEGRGLLTPKWITVKRSRGNGSRLVNILSWEFDWLLMGPQLFRVVERMVGQARKDIDDPVAGYIVWLWDEGYKAWGNRQEPAWWIWKSLHGNLYLPLGVELGEVF